MAHPTFTQPEALRLADALDRAANYDLKNYTQQAASELRRLHAANIDCVDHFNALKAERDELLVTIIAAASLAHHGTAAKQLLDAAISKSTGGQA